ncbi:hypothetical protein KY358_04775 [Candidatus Woesearchaeota archaeon]|nr:hypothetical protein [Candidatus Woesearchaeota archaeon]
MKKKAQLYGSLFRYILIGLIVVMILFFGINAFNKIGSASCQTGIALLRQNLRSSVENVGGGLGSIQAESFEIPCGADQLYLVDREKNMSRLYRSLYNFPLIKDAINSSSGKNAFLVKDGEVIDSFETGDIDLQKPYFVCSDTRNQDLDLYLGSRGPSTEVSNQRCEFDCTFDLIDIDYDTAKMIIEEAINYEDCDGCPQGTLDEEMKIFNETKDKVRISRRCNCGKEPGTTVVEILISPEGDVSHFKLIEQMPKGSGYNLSNIQDMEGDYDYQQNIDHDPLMMWHFNEIKEDTIISYILDQDITGYCADVLKSAGLAVTVASESSVTETTEEDIDKVPEDIEEFDLDLSSFIITLKKQGNWKKNNIFNKPVWKVPKGKEGTQKKFQDYTYEIKGNDPDDYDTKLGKFSNYPDYIICEIEDSEIISCSSTTPNLGFTGTFYLRITNPTEPSSPEEDEFKVTVLPDS